MEKTERMGCEKRRCRREGDVKRRRRRRRDLEMETTRTMAESGREGEVTELRLPTNATTPQRVLAGRSATRSPHMIGG